jgi:hypothetical protein
MYLLLFVMKIILARGNTSYIFVHWGLYYVLEGRRDFFYEPHVFNTD